MKIVLIADTDDLVDYAFNDLASSVKLFKGPNYESGWSCRLHEHSFKDGLGPWIELEAGEEISDLLPKGFNDAVSAVRFVKK